MPAFMMIFIFLFDPFHCRAKPGYDPLMFDYQNKHVAGSTVVPPRIGYIRETSSFGSSATALRQQQLQARKGQLRLSQLNSPTAAASAGSRSMSRHLSGGDQRNSLTFEVHSLSPPQILVGGTGSLQMKVPVSF